MTQPLRRDAPDCAVCGLPVLGDALCRDILGEDEEPVCTERLSADPGDVV